MADERERILNMLEEGGITADEAKELLEALGAAQTKESPLQHLTDWLRKLAADPWVVRSAVLAGLLLGAGLILHGLRGGPHQGQPIYFLTRLASLLLLVFWLWMFVDCLARHPDTLRVKLTRSREYDKAIWIGILLLGFLYRGGWELVLVSLLYYVLGRPAPAGPKPQPEPQPAGPAAPEAAEPAEANAAEAPAAPTPVPGRRPVFLTVLAVLAVLSMTDSRNLTFVSGGLRLFVIPALLFWTVMLVHCLARRPATFDGTITTSPRGDKWLWVAVILFGFAVGAVVYYALGWCSSAPAAQPSHGCGLAQDTRTATSAGTS
jgi:hypothetical protein